MALNGSTIIRLVKSPNGGTGWTDTLQQMILTTYTSQQGVQFFPVGNQADLSTKSTHLNGKTSETN